MSHKILKFIHKMKYNYVFYKKKNNVMTIVFNFILIMNI